jgi:hypothetical protein
MCMPKPGNPWERPKSLPALKKERAVLVAGAGIEPATYGL